VAIYRQPHSTLTPSAVMTPTSETLIVVTFGEDKPRSDFGFDTMTNPDSILDSQLVELSLVIYVCDWSASNCNSQIAAVSQAQLKAFQLSIIYSPTTSILNPELMLLTGIVKKSIKLIKNAEDVILHLNNATSTLEVSEITFHSRCGLSVKHTTDLVLLTL
ncbi:hypothetical protein M8C21_004879, partial [Ambrosia artemisiifolia]